MRLPALYMVQPVEPDLEAGAARMRVLLNEGWDDVDAFRGGCINAGFLENIPAPPPPAEKE